MRSDLMMGYDDGRPQRRTSSRQSKRLADRSAAAAVQQEAVAPTKRPYRRKKPKAREVKEAPSKKGRRLKGEILPTSVKTVKAKLEQEDMGREIEGAGGGGQELSEDEGAVTDYQMLLPMKQVVVITVSELVRLARLVLEQVGGNGFTIHAEVDWAKVTEGMGRCPQLWQYVWWNFEPRHYRPSLGLALIEWDPYELPVAECSKQHEEEAHRFIETMASRLEHLLHYIDDAERSDPDKPGDPRTCSVPPLKWVVSKDEANSEAAKEAKQKLERARRKRKRAEETRQQQQAQMRERPVSRYYNDGGDSDIAMPQGRRGGRQSRVTSSNAGSRTARRVQRRSGRNSPADSRHSRSLSGSKSSSSMSSCSSSGSSSGRDSSRSSSPSSQHRRSRHRDGSEDLDTMRSSGRRYRDDVSMDRSTSPPRSGRHQSRRHRGRGTRDSASRSSSGEDDRRSQQGRRFRHQTTSGGSGVLPGEPRGQDSSQWAVSGMQRGAAGDMVGPAHMQQSLGGGPHMAHMGGMPPPAFGYRYGGMVPGVGGSIPVPGVGPMGLMMPGMHVGTGGVAPPYFHPQQQLMPTQQAHMYGTHGGGGDHFGSAARPYFTPGFGPQAALYGPMTGHGDAQPRQHPAMVMQASPQQRPHQLQAYAYPQQAAMSQQTYGVPSPFWGQQLPPSVAQTAVPIPQQRQMAGTHPAQIAQGRFSNAPQRPMDAAMSQAASGPEMTPAAAAVPPAESPANPPQDASSVMGPQGGAST